MIISRRHAITPYRPSTVDVSSADLPSFRRRYHAGRAALNGRSARQGVGRRSPAFSSPPDAFSMAVRCTMTNTRGSQLAFNGRPRASRHPRHDWLITSFADRLSPVVLSVGRWWYHACCCHDAALMSRAMTFSAAAVMNGSVGKDRADASALPHYGHQVSFSVAHTLTSWFSASDVFSQCSSPWPRDVVVSMAALSRL